MSKPESIPVRPDATYLITGGLGGIGLIISRWLVARGARHLILAGRSSLPARQQWDGVAGGTIDSARITAIRELESLGANVRTLTVDMGNEKSVSGLISQCLRADQAPLRGVFHAAGVMQYELLGNQTPEQNARHSCRENDRGMAPASVVGRCSFGTVRAFLVVVVALEFADDGKLLGRQRVPRRPCSSSPGDRESWLLVSTGARGPRPAWLLDFKPQKTPSAMDGREPSKESACYLRDAHWKPWSAAGRRRCTGRRDVRSIGRHGSGPTAASPLPRTFRF